MDDPEILWNEDGDLMVEVSGPEPDDAERLAAVLAGIRYSNPIYDEAHAGIVIRRSEEIRLARLRPHLEYRPAMGCGCEDGWWCEEGDGDPAWFLFVEDPIGVLEAGGQR